MDGLSKQIASEIGPKWVQLLSKLQLGYRDRYRFCVQHKDEPKPLQEANCTRDTIRLWQQGLGDVAEKEAMTQLLSVLRKVVGFDERARQLAESHGISLELPQPPSTSSQEVSITTNSSDGTKEDDCPTPLVTTSPHLTRHITTTDTPNTSHTYSLSTLHHSSTVSNSKNSVEVDSERIGSDIESSNSISSLPHENAPPFTKQEEQQLPKFRTQSPTLSSASSTERADDYHLLNSPVDVSIMKHKYAILDVCQRLPASVMTDFAQRLNVPQEKVTQITDQVKMHEERYYQVLKFWLEGGGRGGKRTFMELRDALKSCNQQTASDVVLRRLQSPGLTLRTSPVL